MSTPRSNPILIGDSRIRRDTIETIKNPANGTSNSDDPTGLGASTPPSFIPDDRSKHFQIGDYDVIEQIAGHNKGNVYLAVDRKTGDNFICKKYNRREYLHATSVYSKVQDCYYINQISDYHIHDQLKYFAFYHPGMPLENSDKGFQADNLHNYVRTKQRLTEDEAVNLFRQVVGSVASMHDQNVVVRDMKLRKFIFRNQDSVMLECIDDAILLNEGQSNVNEKGMAFPAYVSPEEIHMYRSSRNKSVSFNGKKRDVWRLGIMLYTMLVGRYPFNAPDHSKLFDKIYKLQLQVPTTLSGDCRHLICCLLQRNHNNRPEARDIFRFNWMRDQGTVVDHNNLMIDFHKNYHHKSDNSRHTGEVPSGTGPPSGHNTRTSGGRISGGRLFESSSEESSDDDSD